MSRKKIKGKIFISQQTFLNLIKLGGILTVAFLAPNAIHAFAPILKNNDEWKDYYPSSISKTVIKLWRKGFVEVRETKNGQEVRLSIKGHQEILKYDLNNIEIKTPTRRDRKWRLVFFDISEKRKQARDLLYRKLKQMNFYLMQDSVFIHPFPCEKEIKFIREVLQIPHEVKVATIEKIDNADDLKKIFKEQLFKTQKHF